MLNKFTAAKKIRRQDDYSPGGEAGHRPDRATLVYANRMKEAYSDVPQRHPYVALVIMTTGQIQCVALS